MITILNLIILAFLFGMAYWWSSQGLYSGLLHLLAVIIAGALTLTFWEPLSIGVLMEISPRYAWPVSFLALFLAILLVLRITSDRFLHSNVHFSAIVNTVAGGAFGFLAGLLSAGMLLIGVSFLPIGPSLMGYQPLHIDQNGQVVGQAGNSLWIPVDTMTASFYSVLSSGAFSSGYPMKVYQPHLAQQAALYRMSFAVNGSPTADPNRVRVTEIASMPTPLRGIDEGVMQAIGNAARVEGQNLVAVETKWQDVAGVFDGDSTLRVSSTQIRLIVTDDQGRTSLVAPIGASKVMDETNRLYVPFNDDKTYIWGDGNEVSFAFLFFIKEQEKPQFLLVRHARLNFPTPTVSDSGEPAPVSSEANDAMVRQLAGVVPTAPVALVMNSDGTETPSPMAHTGPNTGQAVLQIEITNSLPETISKNVVQGFQYEGSGVIKGKGVARRVNTALTKDVILDHVDTPSHRKTLRVQLDRERAIGIFGAARVAAAQVNGIWLVDSTGTQWYPVGFVLQKQNGDQKMQFDLGSPLRSAQQLPLDEMESTDKLYLYFSVGRGVTLVSYNVGSQVTPLNMKVE